jgi:hypothetical protein
VEALAIGIEKLSKIVKSLYLKIGILRLEINLRQRMRRKSKKLD